MDKKKIIALVIAVATAVIGVWGYTLTITPKEPTTQPEINNQNNGLLPSEDH